ncbi:indole-3-glycerol phosphate synthase [Desulfacinum hydrothermale DSM 13146]|uniref:Indole-3-glycerol phosphate synthase n=1 Tax=Desulfacinum hydrothermale DSM 13146 TaxID=1121390 RepID=A0A1W1XS28_9BACT|nr:indole-3-glycerol phosphate synthase TrpC [Desulfacinum hydrothermale]SMC26780.1 indole-3-glycerol phosphate synthase [Desulfacinum hydrothermale DSM 13146]
MGILSKILEVKRREVQEARRREPLSRLQRRAQEAPPARPFVERLSAPGPAGANVIAEIKRASPSKGTIRSHLDPPSHAWAYQRAGAAALSVLTDRSFFQGSEQDLQSARTAVSLPVLRKDFVIDEYQIYEARAMGADAVLLIVRAVSPSFLRDALSLCRELGLGALVEVHDERELETALACDAPLVGVNNRDLATFRTDIQTSIRLKTLLPAHTPLVAESGIGSRQDVETLLEAGIFNFLVGTSLVRAPDPERALQSLLGTAPTRQGI